MFVTKFYLTVPEKNIDWGNLWRLGYYGPLA